MAMEIKGLNKSFGKHRVLEDLNFDLKEGEITALVGRNGSGKTTLLKIIGGILEADGGQVLLEDKDLKNLPRLREKLAFLPDRFDYFKYDTGKRAMGYYKVIYPNFDSDFVAREAGRHKISLKKTIRSLSKGNMNLLGLILVLATGAPYLLLDEVLDGMDVLNKKTILRYLIEASAQGRSILVASHQLEALEGIAHRILYLNLDGHLENIEEGRGTSLSKYQIVVRKDLPQELLEAGILRFHLGRVYTFLVDGGARDWDQVFKDLDVVQYDSLPVQLEDLFYWEKGREVAHEDLNQGV
ncbi:MAG: ATP-binding cassette domain-containing protein [Tissierellia bacterium]|nr:ATP-binding cassette domain-containing protein [Tissierellia bacterium]